MLKIKNNVDLKELEKFGFKPKYDEDTGKIKIYKKTILKDNENKMLILKVECLKHITDNRFNPYYKFLYLDGDLSFENGNMFMDFLYDLIQAGLVEKVEEGNE